MVLLKNWPYGPQGSWAQPLFDCVAVPSGVFFSGKMRSQKQIMRICMKVGVCFKTFVILADVDLNLKLEICKIAI